MAMSVLLKCTGEYLEDMGDKVSLLLIGKDCHIGLTEVHKGILGNYMRQSKFVPNRQRWPYPSF